MIFLLTKATKIFLLYSDGIYDIIASVCKSSIKNILNSNHAASFSEPSSNI